MQVEITITNPTGLHARPAKFFVNRAKASSSKITVTSGDKKPVNGKSILGILKLGATQGTTIKVEVDGEDAEQVIADFRALLSEEG